MELPKNYNPKETEDRIYKLWEGSGYFAPEAPQPEKNNPNRDKSFTIIMPPTNANGSLHAGHALVLTIEDIMIRYKRMRGYKTLWLPGLDHAGFETQVVYEKNLEKEGRSRFEIEKQQLYNEILEFTLNNKKNIEDQTRKMGASCDWSRERFTLDSDVIKTVYQTFKKLSDDNLLYRGRRLINWCIKHQTSFSDLEVVDLEQTDKLYYIEYGPFIIATVRPETIFGDVAIAVNPNDKRYKDYVGKEVEVQNPIGKLKLKVIADDIVDMNFGTGALKVTPAHDTNDFELAKRHNLPSIEVIDKFGRLNEKTGKYAGLNREKAREEVSRDFESMGLLRKTEDYKHNVPTCYKCEKILEPRLMPQWFIKMRPLAEKAIKAIKSDEIVYIPDYYKKITLHWLENITDWNISRQIVWGIPIPAKLCLKCDDGFVDLEDKIKQCPTCNGEVIADLDTFDTWFSSSQWPFVSLGYPDNKDYKSFYPTDVLETAGEIIFFWVSRMIIMGLYVTGTVPFRTVYLHGLVLDARGQKMSKSRGNVINPLELTDKYGTDALRIGLVIGNTPGTSLALSENRIRGYKHFANKLWNIARFVLLTIHDDYDDKASLAEDDEECIKKLNDHIKDVTEDMEQFRFYLAAEKIYHHIWHTFADKIVEESKAKLASDDPIIKASARRMLLEILIASLKLLHPFMPFITEEIYSKLPTNSPTSKRELLIVERWPEA